MKLRIILGLLLCTYIVSSCPAFDFRNGESIEVADSKKKDKKKSEGKKKESSEAAPAKPTPVDKNKAIGDSAMSILQGFTPMSAEQERSIGGTIAVKSFADQGGLLANDDVQNYVSKVGLAIVRQTSNKGKAFSFAVVDSDAIESWAAPGGYVFISKGLLNNIQDESELAGVLGHEIAHVTQGHMLTMMKRENVLSGLMSGAQGVTGQDLAQYNKAADVGSDIIFTKGLDHNMEYEADSVGVEYAALTGYDPKGLVRVLTRIKQISGKQNMILSTHPDTDDRISRINARLAGDLKGVDGAMQKERFQKIIGKALTNS